MSSSIRRMSSVALALVVALCLCGVASAQQSDQKGQIQGKVVGLDGKPAPGIKVRLMQAQERGAGKRKADAADQANAANADKAARKQRRMPVAETVTDASGAFSFADVAAGSYRVVAGDKGGPRGNVAAHVSGGSTANVSINLKERKAKK